MTAFELAQRFIGVKEGAGTVNNPQVVAMLRLDNAWPQGDDVAWCSAFVNYVAWLLRLPRSKSLGARSWLTIGTPLERLEDARPGFDVVVLKRGTGDQPGPNVTDAPGHVGFFAGLTPGSVTAFNTAVSNEPPLVIPMKYVQVLGGNQRDQVCIEAFPASQVLGIRRLTAAAAV